MGPLALFLLLCMGHIALAGFSSSSVKHLEPVLGTALNFKSESEETRQRREESFQPFPSSLNLNFEAFGTSFDFDLEIHRELTETGKIIFSGGDDDPVEERPLHHKVYRGVRKNELGEEVGWINLVAHEDGLFHSIMMVGGEIYVVDPLWMHENELDSVVKRDLEVQSEMVIYKTSDMELGGKLCGAVSSKTRTVRNETSNKDIDFGEESTTTLHPEGRIGRNLQTVARWTNCFPSNTVTRRFDVAFYADRGFYAGVGGTQKKAEEAILGLLSSSNIVYYTQVNVYLYPGTMIVKTAANGDAFNQARGACTTIDATLTNFRRWRATQANNNDGTYHLLTDCYPPPGTVGLAYVGVLCDKNYGAGVSTLSSSTWLTVAHEIGHNFGANHAFQLGQGKTGGIMDYGNGKLNGEYQFHTTYNKAEVCNEITSSMAMTGTAKVTNCWKTYAPKCGNGVIEAGEDCDDNSTCCANCKFTAGSVCSTGACCSKCQYLPSTSNCGIQGFCSNGTCVQSPCAQYSNLVFCNMSTTNPCVQTCLYNGKCTPLTSFRGINAYAPDGTICKTAPTIGRCKAGTCVTLAAAEWSAGPWSQCLLPCGAETRNRTVQCMSASGAALPDSQCETEKPNTDTQCAGASCDTLTFVWAKVQGACSATECNAVGTAQNSIQCQVQGGTAVDDSYCRTYNPAAARPAASEECLGSCVVEATYSWIPSDTEWTDCNAKCGENGTRIPVYQCVDKNSGEVVSNTLCTTPVPENIAITCVGACSSTASSKTIGIAVGAAVGGVVLLAALAGALTFYVMKKKQPGKKSPSSDPINPEASFPSPPPPKPNRY